MDNTYKGIHERAIERVSRILSVEYLGENEDKDTALSDLIADLMHFCHHEDIDFSSMEARGDLHFTEEIEALEIEKENEVEESDKKENEVGATGCVGGVR